MRGHLLLLGLLGTVLLGGAAVGAASTHPGVDGGDGGGIGDVNPTEVVTEPEFGVGVAVGAAALGLGAWLAFRGGAKFVTRENVLENDTRSDLYEFLQEKPGTHLRGIADELDLSTTNVLWHLRKLEDADLVKGKKLEGYKVFYPVEGGENAQRKAMASSVLRNDNAQAVLEYVAAEPGAHQRQIARALDVNHGTVRWHLRKMLKTDLVSKVEQGHAIEYYLTDLGADVLQDEVGLEVQATAPPEGEAAGAA
jgi:predicted ArsR family transcriptional regulator